MNLSGSPINIRLGIWLDDLRLGIKAALKTIAPLHPEAIGIDAFSAELSPRTLSQTGRRDLAQSIRTKGMALSAMRADLGGRRLADSKLLDANLTRIREAVQLCADAGAKNLVVPAGYVPPKNDKDGASARSTLSEAARVMAGLVSTAGVRICWTSGSEAPEVLAEFLDEVDSSRLLEVEFHPGAFVMRGIDPLKALNALAERTSMARAIDHYQGGAEAPFGRGDVRWGEVLIGLSTLKRSTPIDTLAGCTLDGERVQALANAYTRLVGLRKNPLG
jgi:sugar phosphate isomerase/epimerase